MKITNQFIAVVIFSTTILFGQEANKKQKENNSKIERGANGIEAPQVVEGDVIFSDGTNNLLRITDEGNFGALQLQDGVPSDATNKLYNNGGTLHFNGTALGSGGATSIDELTDAVNDGSNIYIGDGSGNNSSGATNTALGHNTLFSLSSGSNNTAVGWKALNQNTSGGFNTAIGLSALSDNTTGILNTGVGASSLEDLTSGERNVAIGYGADANNLVGSNNTIIGVNAGFGTDPHSKSGNVFIGYNSGYYETGSNKLYIENSNSNTPLIYGNFALDSVIVNGTFRATNTVSAKNLYVGKDNASTSTYSILSGENNISTATATSTFGMDLKSSSYLATVIGRFNDDALLFNGGTWVGTEPLFVIGNGTDDANRANAVTVLKNGNVGIGPSSPTASLEINAVNGVLFSGATTGSIPVEGSGSRMMWYQGKSAFRAGSAVNQWDDVNIGLHSAAFNSNTIASGIYSFATGYITTASGLHSTAIGSYVNAAGEGTLFIGDHSHTSSTHTANTDNRFAARFANGYRFYTTSDLTVGAKMNAGDNSWSVISDSTKKENFKQVDGEDFLNKISKMKLTSWNYKTQDPAKFRHYGPMAQEFFNAFGNDGIGTVGNDTTIASADFDGINLIAIQTLEKRTAQQDQRIKNQEKRIEELEKQNKELALINLEYRNQNAYLIKEIKQIKQAITNIKKNQKEIKITSN